MSLEAARKLADAVLLEGYVLYPYRASSGKNRFRWTFGVLAPRAWSEAGGCEPFWMETQCLVEKPSRVRGVLRFLHAQPRPVGDLTWDEGHVREIALPDLLERPSIDFAVPGGEGMLPLRGTVFARAEEAGGVVRLSIKVENETPIGDVRATRDEALRSSLIAAHLVLECEGPGFVSVFDPPAWAEAAAAACKQTRCWPVLAGPPDSRDTLLAAPIILYDHAAIAPESPGDLYDNTEIDEILALRTMTLTEEEKREARATDPRARAVVDRVDAMPPEMWSRLHGALRGLHRGEMVPRTKFEKGMRVRLRPSPARRTDAQDLLFAGRTATIESVLRDEQDDEYLAVTIDDDPAAELHRWYGRFHYYRPDEVELLEGERDVREEEVAGAAGPVEQ